MNEILPTSRSVTSQWLPDTAAAKLWGTAVVLSAFVWGVLIFSTPSEGTSFDLHEAGLVLLGSMLLGVAYGSLFASVLIAARAVIHALGGEVPLTLPTWRALKVATLIYATHTSAVGLLFLLGMWKQPWSWYWGVLPFLWA